MSKLFLTTAAAALFLAGCGEAQTSDPVTPAPAEAPASAEDMPSPASPEVTTVSMIGNTGAEIGTGTITAGPNGLLIRVELSPGALTPGWHGLHLHGTGDCSDTDVFKMSGGHVGKIDGGHGLLNPEGPEGGDIPNIWAAADGSAGYEAFTTLTDADTLMDEDGSAILIHEGSDDAITQPIGGAGARVACGVIN